MPLVPDVRRVFGDEPFAQTGEPAVAVVDDRSRLIAVGGDVGWLQWSGDGAADQKWTGHRAGVYERDGLRCRHLVQSSYPVRSLAFHPVLPLLAVATGSYDGGYFFEGELLLVDLDTGTVVSALEDWREVRAVEWLSGTALRLVLSPPDDWDNPGAHGQGHTAVVERADWRAVADGAIGARELAAPPEPLPVRDSAEEARRLLAELAAAAGLPWSRRRRVWAVEGLEDGRVLAALDGVLAESWLPSGERQWAVGDEQGGRQLVPAAGGTSVWANSERRGRRSPADRETTRLVRIAVDGGRVLETADPEGPVVLVPGGGRAVLRPLEVPRGRTGRLVLLRSGGPAEGPGVSGFDPFNHAFPVRRAGRPYLLVGSDPGEPHVDKWVTALEADGTLRRLFPHSWAAEEHHGGGPAVETGRSLVHAGTVHHGHGLQPGGAYVVRRSLTDGAVRWQYRSDHPATALDTDGATVYVTCNSGSLVALDAGDGSVRWRTELRVGGAPTVGLSLAVAPGDRLLVGTVDGRILEYALTR
ncbi:PQQ-binding-like beta-propeller repeat protein [Streptomyces sp. NPDC013953]|uniref:outer membrane protein assembly factor BamB family protein n=1 Tax=Streptomyces sp. NPDC013953 TaxID=3364868 RepID=UPI00370152FB